VPALERVDEGWRWQGLPMQGTRTAIGIWLSFRYLIVGTLVVGVSLLVFLGVHEALQGTAVRVALAVVALAVAGVGAWALVSMVRNAYFTYPVITFRVEVDEPDIVLERGDRTRRILLPDLQQVTVVHQMNASGVVTDTLLRLTVTGRRQSLLSCRRDAELLVADELGSVLPERVLVQQVFR
jgi:hypothetical protein